MLLWNTNYVTARPLASLPRLVCVCSEEQYLPSYHHEGRYRQSETHCIYKYTLFGEGRFRDARGVHRLPAGTGFLGEISDPQTAYFYPEEARDVWCFIYACFDGPAATAMTRDLVQRHGAIYRLPLESEPINRLQACRGKGRTRREITPAVGAALVMDLLLALANAAEGQRQLTPAQNLVQRARDVMESQLADDFNITDLARFLEVSREHLTRVFKEELGVSPYRYLQRQKMLLACQLLKQSELSVKEVSARLGYNTPAHFARTFAQVMHMTPSRFRAVGTVPIA